MGAQSVMTIGAVMRRTQFADNLDLTMDVITKNHILEVFLRHLPWTTFSVVPGPLFCRSVPTVPPTTVVVVKGLEFAATIAPPQPPQLPQPPLEPLPPLRPPPTEGRPPP